MPMLKFKGIKVEDVCTISKELIDELKELIGCPRDYFSLEVVKSIYVRDGEIVDGPSVVEVAWFDRGQEIQDKVAKVITKYIKSIGYSELDVIFHVLEENRYYENGEHF